ncbi:transcriptional regulator (plasmid) [Runella rosea]|uniref:Transcriptional regulator n=1 Tax=Runella rosea TaxID=2259595 RepID=A0A344TTQ2_9BACT|nr:response regulator [Runella rosea]AXE22023.1 transcriptional regulator [Runella rosea]
MKTILLIEDNEIIRENTADILELAGYQVYVAENGKVGVEKALAVKPDLVICDIMMPVLDGYGVLQILNKNPQLAGTPFIFLTAKTERTVLRKGMDLGADDYLMKPFDESDLLRSIEVRLNRVSHLKLPFNLPQIPSVQEDSLNRFLQETYHEGKFQSYPTERKPHFIPKKQYVYLEGDEPIRLFYLKSGQVKTIRTNGDGKEFITGLYKPGDFFGYLPLFMHNDYTDSAVTIVDSELTYIPKADFLKVISDDLEVNLKFIKLMSSRVSDQEKKLLGMAYNSLRRRVADTLLVLQAQQPEKAIHLSRENLAAMIGTTSESLIRTLSEFKHDGFVEVTPQGFRVVQPDKLRMNVR